MDGIDLVAIKILNAGLNYFFILPRTTKAKFSRFLQVSRVHSDHDVGEECGLRVLCGFQPSCATCAFFAYGSFDLLLSIAVSPPLLFFFLRLFIDCVPFVRIIVIFIFLNAAAAEQLFASNPLLDSPYRVPTLDVPVPTSLDCLERVFVPRTSAGLPFGHCACKNLPRIGSPVVEI